ncbi:hypothetical protein Bpfe_024748, partial [Biomphalaria pfeifferi]
DSGLHKNKMPKTSTNLKPALLVASWLMPSYKHNLGTTRLSVSRRTIELASHSYETKSTFLERCQFA